MHLNYAEIFGVESLSLNKQFSKPIHSDVLSNFDVPLQIPEQLHHDLVKAIESFNPDNLPSYSLEAQNNLSYNLVQSDITNISVSSEGLSSDDKKLLWKELINTFKIKSDNS